ncbi:MAG TPA: sulfatase [Longimicrobiales bacterium]
MRRAPPAVPQILAVAAWLGLLAGVVEGVGMLLFQSLTPRTRYVSIDVLWAAPVVNVLLFVALAAGAALLRRMRTGSAGAWLTFFPLALLLFANWLEVLALTTRVSVVAVAILAAGLASVLTRWYIGRESGVAGFCHRHRVVVPVVLVLAVLGVRGGDQLRVRFAEAALPPAAEGQPNVVILVLDALRADHMSAYGYARTTTPNLDRIAREGVLYEAAFSTSPWSLPGHVSLLTGRVASTIGVGWHAPEALQTSTVPVLPEVLRSSGYRTGAISANVFWVTHERLGRGFIRFDDYYASVADILARVNLGRAFERIVLRRLGIEDIPGRRRATDINSALLNWIDEDSDRPFFAFVNYFDVHDPYLPPQPYRTRYAASSGAGGILNWRVGRSDPPLEPAQVRSEIDAYDGALAYLDEAIGALRADLEQREMLDNTILIVVSDHGESFGEHGWFLHGHSLYLEQLRVPLIIRWPGHVPAGRRVRQPVSIAHVPAAIMDLVGGPDVFPGPATALWSDTASRETPPAIATSQAKPWAPEDSPARRSALRSVISACWHLIQSETDEELYDWCADAGEKRDLADSPPSEGVLHRLHTIAGPPSFRVRRPGALGGG